MIDRALALAPQMKDVVRNAVPCGRMAKPEEVSDTIVFLCSPAASYINGVGLLVDGGVTLTIHTS